VVKPIKFLEYDLPNGLHVILHENHQAPVVATYVLYHVGSKNERPDRTGFAHFFEHLMFEGSENIGRGRIDKLISGAGGNLNASTSFDQTDYFFNLPSNQLELALWIESERMMHAKVDETGVETQRRS
jgi:predicted Zn-dependent peptidase